MVSSWHEEGTKDVHVRGLVEQTAIITRAPRIQTEWVAYGK